jgi:hypothetical protein
MRYMAIPSSGGAATDSSNPAKTGWIDLIDEPVHTTDDIDIGDIEAVSRDFIVVKRVLWMYIITIYL